MTLRNTESQPACYMLRRNLPLWKPEQTIAETMDFCKTVGVTEIVWKVDAEEFNHGFTPIDLIKDYMVWLEKAKEAQLREGIVFSINPWLTQNHVGRARYLGGPPEGFHWRVKPGGEEMPEMACPLSSAWREWLFEAYRRYARLEPDKLWIEDDFKTFPHEGYNLGCYCGDHIHLFSETIGVEITRQELVERILKPGSPDPIRGQWFDFQGSVLVDICRQLEHEVHAVSPNTRLGQMLSWSTDGRWWADSVNALAGSLRPLARSSLAPYQENRATDFLPDAFDMLKEISCLPPGSQNCPELENSTYTPYSKSVRMTKLQILMSHVLGHPDITMNLFDMLGTPLSDDPRLGRMLKSLKPQLSAIVEAFGDEGTLRGVSVMFPKRYPDNMHLDEGEGFESFMFDGDGWSVPLQGSGIPVVMNTASEVCAITGQTARSLSASEIGKLLSRGLLLDGSAAAVLQELGYGEQIGVRVGSKTNRGELLLSAERDDWAKNEERTDPVYLSLRRIANPDVGYLFPLTAAEGADTVSVFVDPNHQTVMPGMVIFENDLGGRVAVYPFDLSRGTTSTFMNWHRRRQLQRIVRWLGRDRAALIADGGAWMMPVRRDYDDCSLIAVLNFETDDWDEITLSLDWACGDGDIKFERLLPTGEFKEQAPTGMTCEGKCVIAKFDVHVPALDGIFWRLSAKNGPTTPKKE